MSLSFDPYVLAPHIIQFHAANAMVGLLLGPIALYRRRRDRAHKIIGYIWMLAMCNTAVSSFWITEVKAGQFSAIHVFSIAAIMTIIYALWAVAKGRIDGHKKALRKLYFGVLLALTFTFLPGRRTFAMFFGEGSIWMTFVVMMMISVVIFALIYMEKKRILRI